MVVKNYSTAEKTAVFSAWVSLIASVVILIVKFIAYLQTRSSAVLSDAMESIVNVVAALVALFVMRAVAEPADEEHPYGHGKLEYFSAAFEGGLIAFAAIIIAFAAIEALIVGSKLKEIEIGLLIMIAAGVANFLLALYLLAAGKKAKSEALIASARHIMSDVVTTAGVIVGLGLVKLTGFLWLDAAVAFLVALHLLRQGVLIVRRSIGGLIDEVDVHALKEISKALQKHRRSGLIDIHHLKLIRSGRFHHIDAHVVVPEFWNVLQTHETTHHFEMQVVESYPYDGEIAFHIDPCHKEFCRSCHLKDCSIRVRPFEKLRDFTPNHLIKGPVTDTDY